MPANGREESYPRFQKLWGQILPYLADSDDCTVRPPDRSLKHSIVVERNHKRNTRFSQKCLFGLLRQFEISCFCSWVVKQNIVDGAPPCRSSSHARSTAVGTTVSIETSLSIHWSPASHRSLWFWPPTVKFFDVFRGLKQKWQQRTVAKRFKLDLLIQIIRVRTHLEAHPWSHLTLGPVLKKPELKIGLPRPSLTPMRTLSKMFTGFVWKKPPTWEFVSEPVNGLA